ncbi:MAG: MazG family protein [Eubacterium sp.]|nr:MazG family protein [Eubacterium sp.]
MENNKKFNFRELMAIVSTLRGEKGCPWDKAQTHESLKPYTLEEAYEVNQAVADLKATGDPSNLIEELGDLLFQILLQAQVAEDNGEFTMEDVIDSISRKMIHRHPHVFGGKTYDNYEQQQTDWERIKTEEHGQASSSPRAEFDAVPAAFPALIRGQKITKKAGRRQLISMETDEIFKDMLTALIELMACSGRSEDSALLSSKLGALLFQICRYSASYSLSAENSLLEALDRYIKKY